MKNLKYAFLTVGCLFITLYLLQNVHIIQRSKDDLSDDSSLDKFSPLSSSDVEQVKVFVIFLGHQRSSHSIVGSLLDAHPHIILAHEGRLLLKLDKDTIYGKTFEGENFRGCAQNTPFTGKLSWCIRPMPLCTVHSK